MNRRFVIVGSFSLVAAVVALFWALAPARPPRPPAPAASEASPGQVRPPPASAVAAEPSPARAPVPPALAAELARLLAIADPDERFTQLDWFWRRWFVADREGLFAAIAGLPPGDERAQALHYTLLELARTEPDRALDLALALVRDAQDAHLFSSLFDTFARDNIDLARERLARVPPGLAFDPAWRAFTDAYAHRDLAAALAWARSQAEGPARSVALETALYSLAETDAFTAFEVALSGLAGEARDRALYQALRQIIPGDPAAASALIGGMPPSPQQELAVVEASRAWADEDPARALSWALSLSGEASAASVLAVANILEIQANKDPAAASRAVAGLPEGEARAAAAERVAAALARSSPDAALDWAATLPDPASRQRALAASVVTWAQQDAAAAVAWTAASPADPGRDALFADAVSHWSVQDLAAAAQYVVNLGDAALQQAGALILAPTLAQIDPHAALAWAAKLPGADTRKEATQAIYQTWLDNDPATARAWAAKSGLDLGANK